MDEKRTVELRADDALILFDLLARWLEDEGDWRANDLSFRHDAERHALNGLQGALQAQLVEPFGPDYDLKVSAARRRTLEKFGRLDLD